MYFFYLYNIDFFNNLYNIEFVEISAATRHSPKCQAWVQCESNGKVDYMQDYTIPHPRVHQRKPNRQHLYNTSVSSSLPPSSTSSPICRKPQSAPTTAPPISSLSESAR